MARHRFDDNHSQPEDSAARGEDRLADGLAGPLYSEESQCPCGARAEASRLCAKCRARTTWAQRHAHHNQPDPEGSTRRMQRSGTRGAASHRPESDRPRQQRPRGRRPER